MLGLGLVGKRNKPLLVVPVHGRSAPTPASPEEARDRLVELHLAIHASLDVVEERAAAAASEAGPPLQPYMGLLSLVGRYATFAFVGPTGVKAFVVLDADTDAHGDGSDATSGGVKESEVRNVLVALHAAYQDWLCNPFVVGDGSDDDPVPTPESPGYAAFAKRIAKIATHAVT